MGMGTAASSAYVIEYEELKKLCPEAIENIENESFFNYIGWRNIARWLAWGSPAELTEAIIDAFMEEAGEDLSTEFAQDQAETYLKRYETHIQKLENDFKVATGLELGFAEYDCDSGDRHDDPGDKDGCIFCVEGMTQLTPAGEKFKGIVTMRFWTQYC